MNCVRCGAIYHVLALPLGETVAPDTCSTCRGVACRHCGRPKLPERYDCGRPQCKRATTIELQRPFKVVAMRRKA